MYKQLNSGPINLSRANNPEGYVAPTFSEGADGIDASVRHGMSFCYYIKDHLGNIREVYQSCKETLVDLTELDENNQPMVVDQYYTPLTCIQRMQYYPSGLPWADCYHADEQPIKYNGKEFVEMHGIDEYDSQARWYYPAIMRATAIDPLCEKYYDISPYAWCGNNPVKYIDPDGRQPIYSVEGELLGTDDLGLQGAAIVMDKKRFTQNMSSKEALKLNLGTGILSEEAYKKYYDNYSSLSSRPDWDGIITLKEANNWYRNGRGNPLFANIGEVDMSYIVSLGESYVGQKKCFNLLLTSNSLEAGLVYGQITLKRYPNHQVRAYSDTYNFEMHSWRNPFNWKRNIETIIGNKVAGNGVPYTIHFYGSQTLTPILPWIK